MQRPPCARSAGICLLETGSAFRPLHLEFREEVMAQRKGDSLRTVIRKEKDDSASLGCTPEASASDLTPAPRIWSVEWF